MNEGCQCDGCRLERVFQYMAETFETRDDAIELITSVMLTVFPELDDGVDEVVVH